MVMTQQVDAVYESGMLRPLKPLILAESQRVNLTISDLIPAAVDSDRQFLDEVRAAAA